MASVATIGGWTGADNEVNLTSFTRRVQRSPRGRRMQEVRTASLNIEFIYQDTATIYSHVQSLENSLLSDNKEFRYTVGGTLVRSLLNSGDCCSGIRVIDYSLPKGTPEQWATDTTARVVLQATYDNSEDDLVAWKETTRTVGTGGPEYVVVNTMIGPIAYLVTPTTAVQYYQSGTAVGYMNYPAPPGPLNPQGEFVNRRTIVQTSGRQMGNGLRFFTTSWIYVMGRDVSTFGNLTLVPTSK